MKYRLGLDLGTNSIGWCALTLDAEGKPHDVLAAGVRLLTPNQEAGRDPQSNVSLAADRRQARSARRRRDRFLRRQKRLMETLVAAGLMPQDETARKALEHLDPYHLRAKALDQPLAPHELGRALFHINQRRGFKSNRIADAGDDEKGATKDGMKALRAALEGANARTMGEFLARRHAQRETVRFRPTAKGAKNLYEFYPTRDMVEEEMDAIWAAQVLHNTQLTDDLLARLKRIIIAQRPLKKPLVGMCTFRPNEERAPRALPLFQRYRILTELGNLRVEISSVGSRRLTLTERDALANKLMSAASPVKFAALRKAAKLSDEARFNFEGGSNRDGFDPDLTARVLAHKDRFAKSWRSLPSQRQNEIVGKLLTEENEDVLHEWLEAECDLDPKTAELVANARLPQGHGHLGVSILAELVDAFENESVDEIDSATGEVYDAPLTYDEAVQKLGLDHSDFRAANQVAKLPFYGDVMARHVIPKPDAPDGSQEARGKLPNPTVHIALNQVRLLVNTLIEEYGAPHEIVVELARELKWGQKRKDEYNKQLKENTDLNKQRRKKLDELAIADNGANRLRMKLYDELKPDERVCVYSGVPISQTDLFSGAVEIDHILPFSLTLDDSFLNKVLCTREANRKKANRPPADAFSASQLEEIFARAERILEPRKAKRFLPDAMERFDEEGGWQARHLTDTQHMARLAKEYLGHVTVPDRVWAVPGRMTSMLRGMWGLGNLLPGHNQPEGKDRSDHRHHTVDAFVVACSDRRLLKQMSNAASRSEKIQSDRLFAEGLPEPFDGFRQALEGALECIVVSHKRDHGTQGQLHEETAYGLVNAEIDGKSFNLVRRKPVVGLTPSEISQVRNANIRADLTAVAEAAKRDGTKLADALDAYTDRTGVRRVRVLKTQTSPIVITHGKDYRKAYTPADNHHIEIYQDSKGKWHGEGVTVFNANQPGWKPHWHSIRGAKLVMRIHSNDMLEADFGDGRQIYRVCILEAGNNRLRLAGNRDGGSLQKRHADPDDPFRWLIKSYGPLQAAGARIARVDVMGRVIPAGD